MVQSIRMDIQNFIGKQLQKPIAKREYRNRIVNEKQNILLSGQMSDVMSDKSPPESRD